MVHQVFQLLALYLIYYLLIPGLILFTIWKIKKKGDFIKVIAMFKDGQDDKSSKLIRENKGKLRKFKVLLVVLILISIPALNLTSHLIQDVSMHRSRLYLSGETVFPGHFDLIDEKIGPSFDADEVLEKMDSGEEDWYLESIKGEVDLDQLTRYPGRMTVYKISGSFGRQERVVINYDFLSPLPFTRSLEFIIIEEEAFLEADNTVIYPMPPSMAAIS